MADSRSGLRTDGEIIGKRVSMCEGKHSEGKVGRKKTYRPPPQLCESRVGLQGWLTEQDGPHLPPSTLNTPQLLAKEEEEALITQKTTVLDTLSHFVQKLHT